MLIEIVEADFVGYTLRMKTRWTIGREAHITSCPTKYSAQPLCQGKLAIPTSRDVKRTDYDLAKTQHGCHSIRAGSTWPALLF